MPLEEMAGFFDSRIDSYEEHMLKEVDLADDYYIEIAGLIPAIGNLTILDLGCGTGLELDEIFKINPDVWVTGVDLAGKMLDKLRQKHADKENRLNLVLADYLECDFGVNIYDIALSVQSLHHFSHEEKIGLYKRVYCALKHSGFYIESDYVAPSQESEDFHFAENKRIRTEQGIMEGLYHYDTPCTVENQVGLLKKAGFGAVEIVSRHHNCATLLAGK
jgi:tRNA (cmo5U34)-methyltransferase